MKLIGAHLPIGKGIWTIQKQMELLGCKSCAIFLKSQRTFTFKPLEQKAQNHFISTVKNPQNILPHGSYLINLANDSNERGYQCLIDDLKRCVDLGICLYNLHPGSDVNKRGNGAYKLISDQINKAHVEVPSVIICLENMAGQGNTLGRTFEELKEIIDGVSDKARIGVTLDTCHLFGGGYDIRTSEKFGEIMKDFDRIVGLKYLKAMHLNDSKCDLDTRKDRHECLGNGKIGLEAFKYIMNSPLFEDIPLILETPEPDKYKSEIELLFSLIEQK